MNYILSIAYGTVNAFFIQFLFSVPNMNYILFLSCSNTFKYYAYLIIITITTYDISADIAGPATDVTPMGCSKINNFEFDF